MRAEFEALQSFAGARELGNLTLAAEDARAAWGWAWLDSLLSDVRYAFRVLARERLCLRTPTNLPLGRRCGPTSASIY